MNDDHEEFINEIVQLCSVSEKLAKSAVMLYEPIVDNLIRRMSNGESVDTELENVLTYMLDFCFYDGMLLLYKKLLRAAFKVYPKIVIDYVNAYREMYEEDDE